MRGGSRRNGVRNRLRKKLEAKKADADATKALLSNDPTRNNISDTP